jgi:hypothetical protein
MKGGKMKKFKKEKKYACCDEEKMTCEPCSFEESIKIKKEDE